MPTYRNVTTRTLWVRRAGVVVESLGVFTCDFEINDANFELVKEPAKKPAGDPGKEE